MLVSIIVPIYNAELYLPKCIESILSQTFFDFELLLIDDGSSDNSSYICDEYAIVDNRIKVLHQKNGGSAKARNIGLELASGEFIVFIDADDYIEINYLEKLVKIAISKDADIVQCDFCKVKNNNFYKQEQLFSDLEEFSNVEFLKKFCEKKTYLKVVVLWNKIYKKSLFKDLKFPEGKGIDDEFLICEIIYRARKIIVIDEVLYFYVMSENSQMRSKPSLKKLDGIKAIEEHLKLFERINQPELYKMTKYRYYIKVMEGYYFVKKNFPEQRELIFQLRERKKHFYEIFQFREISLSDKIILLVRNYFPHFFNIIYRTIKKID